MAKSTVRRREPGRGRPTVHLTLSQKSVDKLRTLAERKGVSRSRMVDILVEEARLVEGRS